jgi:ribosomal protein L11 methyltransferase
MANEIAAALAPGAPYAASGIIAERADMVDEALRAAGLTVDERLNEDDWVALVGRRP